MEQNGHRINGHARDAAVLTPEDPAEASPAQSQGVTVEFLRQLEVGGVRWDLRERVRNLIIDEVAEPALPNSRRGDGTTGK